MTIDQNTLFKCLNYNNRSTYQNTAWNLPDGDQPGDWMEVSGNLVACENGLHLCYGSDLLHWLSTNIYVAEYDGELVNADTKVVVRKARLVKKLDTWNSRTWVLFACDCAEQALMLIPNPDPRSIEGIRVARLYAEGKATKKEIDAADADAAAADADAAAADADAAAAARYAAAAAARYAAAADAADADAARYAARYAAAAARYAAAAARYAAAAAHVWQTERLMMYLRREL